MTLLGLAPLELTGVLVAFAAAGIVRGFTGGFGANFLIAPVLSALIGPREAVPIVILTNMVSNVQLMPTVLPHVRWGEGWPLFTFPVIAVPLGAWVLFSVDEDLMRRVIAGAAVCFSLVLLRGWRYRGRHAKGISVAVGWLSGFLVGAISLGGPPVFLYLMAGPGDATMNRAHFVVFGFAVGVTALASFALSGAYTLDMLILVAAALPPSIAGTWLGARLFTRASEAFFRRFCLWGLVVVSLAVLVL